MHASSYLVDVGEVVLQKGPRPDIPRSASVAGRWGLLTSPVVRVEEAYGRGMGAIEVLGVLTTGVLVLP